MKYIKTYENKKGIIPNGEYVIAKPHLYFTNKVWTKFMTNNVGKIISHYIVDNHLIYIVDYQSGIGDGYRRLNDYDIIAHSKDKKELELILTAKKYNL